MLFRSNSFFGTRLPLIKARLRSEAKVRRAVTRQFMASQKALDHFTGRDPFYLLLFFAAFCGWRGLPWTWVLLNLLVGGCYLFALGYLSAEVRLRTEYARIAGRSYKRAYSKGSKHVKIGTVPQTFKDA